MHHLFTLLMLHSLVFFSTGDLQKKPKITGQYTVSTLEENSLEIMLSQLIVEYDSDGEEEGADDPVLIVDDGKNYDRSGNTITPKKDFSGTLSVPVHVNNQGKKSNKYDMQVTVVDENDPPTITGQSNTLQTQEEQPLTISLADLIVSDPDNTYPDDFTLTVYGGSNYSVSGSTITPTTDYYGDLAVPVSVSDGTSSSNTFDLVVTVNNVNDAPVITGQQSVSTNEDTAFDFLLSYLTVTDTDNTYPTGFTLSISAGDHYTVSGATITPEQNFAGTLTVPVTVNDGSANSGVFNASVTVTAVNDKPSINSQNLLSVNEDESLAIKLSDFSVTDPDNNAGDLTLVVQSGDNYTSSGNTITPSANFNGTLTVPVVVSDGANTSDVFSAQVSVAAVNDAPVISAQASLETPEGQAITIAFSDLTVSDPDNSYPSGFTMQLQSGGDYSVSGQTVTPNSNFNGTLSVPVTVNDGSASSNVFSLQITVTAVNAAPVITGQKSLSVNEDQSLTITLNDLTVTDNDNAYPDDFTLTLQTGDHYSLSGSTITPAQNFNGTLSIPVTVSDGSTSSGVYQLQVTVVAQNDAPTILNQGALSVNEDNALTITLADLSVSDIDNTYPNGFSLAIASGSNYTVNGNTITPSRDYSGTLTVPVTVNDGQASSSSFNLSVTVTPVNDAPLITGQTTLTTNEDTPIAISLHDLTVQDVDNTFPNNFSLSLSAGDNYTLSGTSVVPAENFSGTLQVPVTVSDGLLVSASFNVSITVVPVNDAPVITGQSDLRTDEETPITVSLSNLVVADVDNVYPNGFTMKLSSGENYTIDGMTITPAANFAGDLSVPVVVNDGTADSAPFNLMISVVGENDPPVITGQVVLTTNEDEAIELQLAHLMVTDSDNSYPKDFTLTVKAGENYIVSGNQVTPAKDFSGTLSVALVVNDGTNNSNTFNVSVQVTPVNDAPVIESQSQVSIYKNKPVEIIASMLQVKDPDNTYPDDFTLAVESGEHFTVVGTTVTPSADFIGTLEVPVTVNDGSLSSEVFMMNILVTNPPNVVPVIVSQVKLTTYENVPLTLELSNLVVTDPDNKFPDDFKLKIQRGEHYTLDNNKVVPEKDFSGTLRVPVTVSDKESTSAVFNVVIDVLPVADVPLITSQVFLRINEDDSLQLDFSDLIVLDPDNSYPSGFTMALSDGDHYSVSGTQIKPEANYNGYLSVPVTVNDGANTSTPYLVLVLVEPVDDAPVISFEKSMSSLYFALNKGPLKVFEDLLIEDVDDDSLAFAEISIDPDMFQPGKDTLSVAGTTAIRSVYDREAGLLLLFGKASAVEYQDLINNINYEFVGARQDLTVENKSIQVTVNDGRNVSNALTRTITFSQGNVVLDIPTGFTPNGDGANDTWNIKGVEGNELFSNAEIRVYDKHGVLVFETKGFDREWDGRMNGVLLPADAYFYTIDLHGAVSQNRYKGVITLLR